MNIDKSAGAKANHDNVSKTVSSEIEKWWGKIDNPVFKVGNEFTIFFR